MQSQNSIRKASRRIKVGDFINYYQLHLQGYYRRFGGQAKFFDKNIFPSKELITDEYVKSVKQSLFSLPISDWDDKEEIKEYIITLTVKA